MNVVEVIDKRIEEHTKLKYDDVGYSSARVKVRELEELKQEIEEEKQDEI